jgi:hypothetical protein
MGWFVRAWFFENKGQLRIRYHYLIEGVNFSGSSTIMGGGAGCAVRRYQVGGICLWPDGCFQDIGVLLVCSGHAKW